MVKYYLVFSVAILTSFLLGRVKLNRSLSLIIILLPLFIFGAFRTNFGRDYSTYHEIFEIIHKESYNLGEAYHVEKGYQFLNLIFPTWRSFLVFNTVLVLFSYGLMMYSFVRRDVWWLFLLLLFSSSDKAYIFSMVGIRNALTISILALSFMFVVDQKRLKFLLLTLFTSTIHTSALIFYPLVYLFGTLRSMSNPLVLISILLVSSGTLYNLIFYLTSKVSSIGRYLSVLESAEMASSGLLALFAASIMTLLYHRISRRMALNIKEKTIVSIGYFYPLTFALGGLNFRVGHHLVLFYITAVMIMFTKEKRLGAYLIITSLVVASYSFLVVWYRSSAHLLFDIL